MANDPGEALTHYDPVKAHEYYERTKKLKGRHHGVKKVHPAIAKNHEANAARQKVVRLKGKVKKLEHALSEVNAQLSKSRQNAAKTAKANSDGKSTAAQKTASKDYRDKHQTELASQAKATTSTSSSSSSSSSSGSSRRSGSSRSSSSSSSQSVAEMEAPALRARRSAIKSALRDARTQLSNASHQLGQLAHSAMASDPDVGAYFAQLQSAERIPSQ